jgi:hypothetical protein
MAVNLGLLQSLIEMWGRRSEPEDSDLPRAIDLTKSIETDEAVPPFIKGFAFRTTKALHEAAGKELPENKHFVNCEMAAESVAKNTAGLLGDIACEVVTSDNLVLVLGMTSVSKSLFGEWDLLPADGAQLISLVPPEQEVTHVEAIPAHRGVHWGSAGSKLEMLDRHSTTVQVNGITIRIPNTELIAARTTSPQNIFTDLDTFVFCAAAWNASRTGTWKYARRIARKLGHEDSPRNAVIKLGLAEWLGIEVPPLTKVRIKVKTLFRR